MGIPGQPKVESFGSAYSDNAYGAVSILSPVIEGRKRPTRVRWGLFCWRYSYVPQDAAYECDTVRLEKP
jgi:hypothetical protein